jgi:two-component system sensor histidine kinase/response regulator
MWKMSGVLKTESSVLLGERKNPMESFVGITERKHTEEVLREAEERYPLLFENSTNAVLIRDQEGIIRLANPAAFRMLKASRPDQIIGKSYLDFVHPEDRSGSIDRIQRQKKAVQEEPEIDPACKVTPLREHRLVTLKGETIYVESTGVAFCHQGKVWIQGNFHDITQRKQTEDGLRKTEEIARRMAQENAIVAEIGRIISSSLRIEDIYEKFAEKARQLLSFDWIAISIINHEKCTFRNAYISGDVIPGRGIMEEVPLAGSFTEDVMSRGSRRIIDLEDTDEVASLFPKLSPFLLRGYRSFMAIPLTSDDQVVGALHIYSKRSKAFHEANASLGERIAVQIAGAIANSQLFQDRKRVEEALREREERYRSILESMEEGYFEVDLRGRFTFFNDSLRNMLGFSKDELMEMSYREYTDEKTARKMFKIFNQVYSAGQPVKILEWEVIRRDGKRAFHESSVYLIRNTKGKRIGFRGIVRDITEREKMEETLRCSEEAANRLAQENSIIAEVGRIISSTLNIEEVYQRFAQEVQRLFPAERCVFTVINSGERTATTVYASGIEIPSRLQGEAFPLAGSATEKAEQARSGLIIPTEDENEVAAQVPGLLPVFRAGIRSVMMIPLMSRDQVVGVLNLQSVKPKAYSGRELSIAERIGNQVGGAIANARLYKERMEAEEAARRSEGDAKRLAQENAVMAEISRIISSSLNIEEVYERFGEEVRKLIPFDRIAINLIDPQNYTLSISYVSGSQALHRQLGDVLPLAGTAAEEILKTRSSLFIQVKKREEVADRYPGLLPILEAGYQSIIMAPLISENEVIGVLNLQSKKADAYDGMDLKLIERVSIQISGAIANAQLFAERKQAEEALRKSEATTRQLAMENEIIASIGRITSTTLTTQKLYEGFDEEAPKIIAFDRIVIDMIDTEKGTVKNVYIAGEGIPDREVGEVYPLQGSGNAEMVRSKSTLLIQTEDFDEYKERFPMLLSTFQAGFRSILNVPLFSKGEVIGGLLLRSRKPYAYSDKDVRVAERIADQIAGAIANAQLLSGLQQAEEALRASEESFRSIVQTANDAIVNIDRSGKVILWNKAAEKIFGLAANAMIGQTLSLIVPERFREGHIKRLKHAGSTEEFKIIGTTVEVAGLRKDGSEFPIELSLATWKKNGEPFFTAIIRDITERKRAENELLLAKEAADTANKAKSEFLANMSHEIRTPMNGIIGMTGLLLDTPLVPEQREYAEAVRVSADSLLRIINDILDFSKIEAGKMDLEILDFDLRTTVEDTVDMVAVKAEEKKLELACLIHHEVPSLLRGDPGRLRQILLNLAGNAIKFTEKGEVVIGVTLEDESDTHVRLRFAVRDTGNGISKDSMDRLFKSFSQVDASTTRRFGGTGLGLSISKKIVEMMGGQIGVESEEGRGSTFWFTGIFEKQPAREETTSFKPADIRGLRILVVEDNPTNRIVLREQLLSWGCLPEEAPDGESAWVKLQEAVETQNPFHLAILDMEMPRMDGAMLGRKIKGDPKLRSTMLVLLTSRGNRGDAKEMKEIGFSAYLTKPIKASQLHDCLMLVVSQAPLEPETQAMPIVTRHSLSEDKKRKFRILLAEDNVVNQKVALRILGKLGYRADAVANGKEVVSALENISYDLILMDVQMPEMDGFEATAAIRRKERETGNHIPIIAMTAHAMKGDREQCLEAGMDDYVSKPINPQSLTNAIQRWFKKAVLMKPEVPFLEPSEEKELFDKSGLLDRLGGDEVFLREILGMFLDDAPNQIERMQKQLKEGDLSGLELQAHSLKGAAMNIGGNGLQKAAFELEVAARNRELARARGLMAEILKEFKRLKIALGSSIAPKSGAY